MCSRHDDCSFSTQILKPVVAAAVNRWRRILSCPLFSTSQRRKFKATHYFSSLYILHDITCSIPNLKTLVDDNNCHVFTSQISHTLLHHHITCVDRHFLCKSCIVLCLCYVKLSYEILALCIICYLWPFLTRKYILDQSNLLMLAQQKIFHSTHIIILM